MPKFKELDFSKQENQEFFNSLPQNIRDEIINCVHEVANRMQSMIKSGEAQDYDDAINQLAGEEKIEKEITIGNGKFHITITSNNNWYLDVGGGKTLMGNSMEGAIKYNNDGIATVDLTTVDENTKRMLAEIDALIGKTKGQA